LTNREDSLKARMRKRRKVCQFCVDKTQHIDYKDTVKLRRYMSERSKILRSQNNRHMRYASASAHRCYQESSSDRSPPALHHRVKKSNRFLITADTLF
jgi:ribosomal protein S18